MMTHGIQPPTTFITDRELALMNTLNDLFPEPSHNLCICEYEHSSKVQKVFP